MEPKVEQFEPYSVDGVSTAESSPSGGRARTDSTSRAPADDYDPESSVSSPTSIGKSPDALAYGSNALSSEQDEGVSSPEVSSRRPSSAKSSSDKEKRKRSRVTPDQLVHLERFFSVDRSPTAARRREISDLLGMQERQTQIWFQNRRAKAKLLDGKSKSRTDVTPPDTPPELRPGYDASLHNLIHENDPVTIIPCSDLTIGTWRRIAPNVSKHDLVAYVCDSRRCLVWFIHSSGYGFKMEIPFDIIVETQFTNAAPGSGLASFFLSQPPTFYLEDVSPSDCNGPAVRSWKRCADWTEGMQATKVLRHDLIGSAVQLAHVLRNFQVSAGGDIRLRSPSYSMRADHSPALGIGMELPRSLGVEPPSYRSQFGEPPDLLGSMISRKRASFTGQPLVLEGPPDAVDYSVDGSAHSHPHPHSAHTSPTPPYQSYGHLSSSGSTSSTYSSTPLYTADIPDAPSHAHHQMGGEYGVPMGQRMFDPQGYQMHQGLASAPAAHLHFGGATSPSPPYQDMGIGGGGGGALLMSGPPVMPYQRSLGDDRR